VTTSIVRLWPVHDQPPFALAPQGCPARTNPDRCVHESSLPGEALCRSLALAPFNLGAPPLSSLSLSLDHAELRNFLVTPSFSVNSLGSCALVADNVLGITIGLAPMCGLLAEDFGVWLSGPDCRCGTPLLASQACPTRGSRAVIARLSKMETVVVSRCVPTRRRF